ncbi:hypothetical protein H5410_024381 [Solanum commersonii]|uniref:Uncharacterized protein n=1 Tax=Solanum commersonii TaxID=4109 RepID=A0A9J5ZLU6_SOLCO|nr:hypothetical protein H5410_024381 [Solanum commersonii]
MRVCFKAPPDATGKAEPYDSVNSFNKIQYIQEEVMNYQVLLDIFEEEDKMKILQRFIASLGLTNDKVRP